MRRRQRQPVRTTRTARRDADYRGRGALVDWGRLVHNVRTRKTGALEVLQDAINEYFPRQFRSAQAEAQRRAGRSLIYDAAPTAFWVGFDARRARQRFLPRTNMNATDETSSPFFVRESRNVRTSQPAAQSAYVYVVDTRARLGRRLALSRPAELAEGSPRFKTTTREAEQQALRPRYTGSYRRPKLPLMYFWEQDAPDADIDPVQVWFYVRGPGAGAWARERGDILGERWDVPHDDFAAARVDGPGPDWRREIRAEGYRNKLRYLEEPPPRAWATR